MLVVVQVSDFYKRPNLELSPVKVALEETSHAFDNRGVQMLGQIKHGSCRPRAILFKVLADTVGLESTLMVVSILFFFVCEHEMCGVYMFALKLIKENKEKHKNMRYLCVYLPLLVLFSIVVVLLPDSVE